MRVTHSALLAAVGVVAVVAVAGMVWLWPSPDLAVPADATEQAQATELVDAEIVDVAEVSRGDVPGLLADAITVEITARLENSGRTVIFEMTDDTGTTYEAGQQVRLARVETPGQPPTYFVSDFRRGPAMTVLLAAFLLAVLAFGRFQGLRALIGLGSTFVVIVGFMLPAILDGRSPVAVALVGSLAIMVLTLYLSHGPNPKTTAALVGTTAALLATVALAGAFVAAANITGFTSEEARLATYEVGGLSLRGLVLAGIIIGSLGVLDDVTVSQASTVFELRRADPSAAYGTVVRGALNVGRDHIAATINTLFLAYAGASLPLLIIFSLGVDALPTLLTSEVVAVEVVRTLVGSIGLIAAVPLTTVLAAAVVMEPERRRARGSDRRPSATSRASGHAGPRKTGPEPTATEDPQPDGDDEGDDAWEQRLREAYRLDRPRR